MLRESERRAVEGAAGRHHWKEAQARVVIVAWRRSGWSRARFSRETGVSLHRLRYWSERIGGAAEAGGLEPLSLVPVQGPEPSSARAPSSQTRPESSPERDAGILIEVGEARVRVRAGFCAPTLAQVLAVLRSC